MRRIAVTSAVLALLAAAQMAGAGSVAASGTGPSGSSEDGSGHVTCNSYPNAPDRVDVEQKPDGVAVHGNTGTTYAGTNGAEACGDNGNSWRGRAYADGNGVTYDGATWAADPTAADNGCVSAGPDGVNANC